MKGNFGYFNISWSFANFAHNINFIEKYLLNYLLQLSLAYFIVTIYFNNIKIHWYLSKTSILENEIN